MTASTEQQKLKEWIDQLSEGAGKDKAFANDFFEKLCADPEIYEEFLYYAHHGNFACKAKVAGCTVVDIMVWQMDHFKAWLDRDTTGTKQNGDSMLLLAFSTLLEMRKAPEVYLQKMQYETGTDYPDKY